MQQVLKMLLNGSAKLCLINKNSKSFQLGNITYQQWDEKDAIILVIELAPIKNGGIVAPLISEIFLFLLQPSRMGESDHREYNFEDLARH